MAQHFCIYDNATGDAHAFESDASADRLTDQQLTAMGKTRVAVDGPLLNTERWNPVTHAKETIPVGLDAIVPPVTKAQATAILKALLEDPPTGPSPWTDLQRDQYRYLMLLGLFRDLKNGNVY